MKWLINFSRKRNEKSMAQKLAAEILAASKEEGSAVKKRVDTHKWPKQIKHSHTLDFNQKWQEI